MAAGHGHSPIEQFQIKEFVPLKLFGFNAAFTNSSMYMLIALGLITAFLVLAMRSRSLVPGRTQSVAELIYEFVANTVRENVGEHGMKFFPLVFSLFVFVLVVNVLGMIPIRRDVHGDEPHHRHGGARGAGHRHRHWLRPL